jgi:hypothetical protein
MNPTSKIYAPNVHLFAYHLWDALNSGSNAAVNPQQPALNPSANPALDREHLWQKCNQILQENLKLNAELNSTNLYRGNNEPAGGRVNLIVENAVDDLAFLPFEKSIDYRGDRLFLEGFAQPQRIGDSYALGFNIRIPEKIDGNKTPDVDLSIFRELNPNNCLLPKFVSSYFGQTLLLTAWLTDAQKQEMQEDAEFIKKLGKQCLEKFIYGENQPEFYRQGELFGSPILEYGNPYQQANYCHILIWFFNSPTADKLWDADCYNYILELLLYRNKIILAYWESRQLYRAIRREYEQIEFDIDRTFKYLQRENSQKRKGQGAGLNEEELEYLETQILEMPPRAVKYARSLIDLEFRKNTIAINAKNYRDKLTEIKLDIATQKKYDGSDADLSFLEFFSTETCPQFEDQIEFDLRYFRQGTGLLDKAMEAIRGTVAIEEAYRNAKLEVTIQAVGFGLGVAGVVAGSAPYLIKEEPGFVPLNLPFAKLEISAFALVLFMSIGAGAIVWMLVLSIANRKQIIAKFKKNR